MPDICWTMLAVLIGGSLFDWITGCRVRRRALERCPKCRSLMSCSFDWDVDEWECPKCSHEDIARSESPVQNRAMEVLDRLALGDRRAKAIMVRRLASGLTPERALALVRESKRIFQPAGSKKLGLILALLSIGGLIGVGFSNPSSVLERIFIFPAAVSFLVLALTHIRPRDWLKVSENIREITLLNSQPTAAGYLATLAQKNDSAAIVSYLRLAKTVSIKELQELPSSEIVPVERLVIRRARRGDWDLVGASMRILSNTSRQQSISCLSRMAGKANAPMKIREQATEAIQAIEANIAKLESTQNLLRAAVSTEHQPEQLLRRTDHGSDPDLQ